MSVTNEVNKVIYAATGLSVYAIPFKFTSSAHIKLYVDDVLKTLTTDYTVTGMGSELGGELTLVMTPPVSGTVTILRDIPLKQENTFNEGGQMPAKIIEAMFDKLTHLAQQINEKISRAITLPVSSSAIAQISSAISPGAILQANEDGDGLEFGFSAAALEASMVAKLASAEAANSAAQTAEENAGISEASALESANNAAISESNAEASASSASDSAALAQQAADSVLFNDVIFITAGMSPVTLDESYRGVMLACDCSAGPIVFNLPLISSLDLNFPWTVSIKKTDSSGNAVTINRSGSNLIDEGVFKTIGSAGAGLTLIPDADPSPDVWTTAEFGAAAGNITTERFSGTGAQTAFTLSVAPGSENNTQVFINGVYQQKDTYSVSGTTLTFDEAPIVGVNNIEVNIGTTLPVGTPSDSTVTTGKIVDGAVTKEKIPASAGIEMSKTNFSIAILSDVKSSGTAGGSNATGTWQKRTINTEVDPDGIVSLSGDQFTITQAGTYLIEACAPGVSCEKHKTRIRNITDNSTAIVGESCYANNAYGGNTHSRAEGVVTIAAAKTFELQHWMQSSGGASGLGFPTGSGESEVYSTIKVIRIK